MTARRRQVVGFVTLVLIGAAAGVATSFLLPRTYVSIVSLRIEQKLGSSADWFFAAAQFVESRNSLSEIIRSEGLYKPELDRLPMEDVIQKMRTDIEIARSGRLSSVNEIRVRFQYNDGAAAELTTRSLMNRIMAVPHNDEGFKPSLEVLTLPRRVQSSGTGFGRILGFHRAVLAMTRSPIAYEGVLRVRDSESVSAGAPDANQLRNLVIEATKELALLDLPAGQSIDGVIEKMQRRLRFETGQSGDELKIFYTEASPAQAQHALERLVSRVFEMNVSRGGPVIDQVDPASLPESHEGWAPLTMAAIGACAGFVFGLVRLAQVRLARAV